MRLPGLREARDDIRRPLDYFLERDRGAAERAIRAIQLGAGRLCEYPAIGRRMDGETERRELFMPFGVGSYVLRYRIAAETSVVIRVWHSREVQSWPGPVH